MKKILTFFSLALFIALTGVSETAYASSPIITCESKECNPGEKVSVDVSINNNPGIMYLEMTPVVASELGTPTVKNGSLFSDLTKNKQYIWVADEDVSANGKLMSFEFSIGSDVPAGEYSVGFIFRAAYNYNEKAVTFAVNNGKIKVKGSGTPSASFEKAWLSVAGDLTMHFSLAFENVTIPKAVATINGNTKELTLSKSGNYYLADVPNISFEQMSDDVQVDLYDGTTLLNSKTYSVSEYCESLQTASASELELSKEKYDAMIAFVADMLECGAMAQKYAGHNIEELSNTATWVAEKKTNPSTTPTSAYKPSSVVNSNFRIKSATLQLSNEVKFVVRVVSDRGGKIMFMKGSATDYFYSSNAFEGSNAEIRLISNAIKPCDFDSIIQIQIESESKDASQTIGYSVNSYLAAMWNAQDEALRNLVHALYNYGLSAKQYNSVS